MTSTTQRPASTPGKAAADDQPARIPHHHRLAGKLVLASMLVAGVFMWVGNPYMWLRIVASQAKTQGMTMSQFLILLGGIAVTGIVMIKVLQLMQDLYARLNGGSDEVVVRMPWTKSMRDSGSFRRSTSALDVIMVASVSIAVVAFAVWFVFLGGAAGGGGTAGTFG